MSELEAVITTGRASMVGSRVEELLNHRFDFTADLDVVTTRVDITDRVQVRAAIGSARGSVVIHFAAFTDVGQAAIQANDLEGSCYRVNAIGTQNVAEACEAFGKHLINFSTDHVHDGTNEDYYTEETPRHPIEWYGKTKGLAEEIVEATCHSYTTVRIAFPYKADNGKIDSVRRVQAGLAEGNLPPQFSDNLITPTFVDDIAGALAIIIRERPQGIVNIVGSTSLSAYDLGCRIAVVSGYDESLVPKGSLTSFLERSNRPYHRYLQMSNKHAVEDLGIEMHTIDEGLDILISQQRKLDHE